jgi:hypothetical protein
MMHDHDRSHCPPPRGVSRRQTNSNDGPKECVSLAFEDLLIS